MLRTPDHKNNLQRSMHKLPRNELRKLWRSIRSLGLQELEGCYELDGIPDPGVSRSPSSDTDIYTVAELYILLRKLGAGRTLKGIRNSLARRIRLEHSNDPSLHEWRGFARNDAWIPNE